MDIQNNISKIKISLGDGCQLVAVSKTKPAEMIIEAYGAGHRDFGENRVQELIEKHELLPKDIRWHMIGHLQTNKVKYIAPFVHLVHAVDSEKLLKELQKQAKKNNRKIHCLLQVHIAREETKHGWGLEELEEFLRTDKICDYDHVIVEGLMGMATFTNDTEQIRKEFRALKGLFDRVAKMETGDGVVMQTLSMGMSGDYLIAAEEGSTLVRVGSAIFGDRN